MITNIDDVKTIYRFTNNLKFDIHLYIYLYYNYLVLDNPVMEAKQSYR